jgi:hypothetical protein
MPHSWSKNNRGFWCCSKCKLVLSLKKKPRKTRRYPARMMRGPFVVDIQDNAPRYTCEELQTYKIMES